MMNAEMLMRRRAAKNAPPAKVLTHAEKEARVFNVWGKTSAEMAANCAARLEDYLLEHGGGGSGAGSRRDEEKGVQEHTFRDRNRARELGRGTVVAKPYVPRAVFKGGGQLRRRATRELREARPLNETPTCAVEALRPETNAEAARHPLHEVYADPPNVMLAPGQPGPPAGTGGQAPLLRWCAKRDKVKEAAAGHATEGPASGWKGAVRGNCDFGAPDDACARRFARRHQKSRGRRSRSASNATNATNASAASAASAANARAGGQRRASESHAAASRWSGGAGRPFKLAHPTTRAGHVAPERDMAGRPWPAGLEKGAGAWQGPPGSGMGRAREPAREVGAVEFRPNAPQDVTVPYGEDVRLAARRAGAQRHKRDARRARAQQQDPAVPGGSLATVQSGQSSLSEPSRAEAARAATFERRHGWRSPRKAPPPRRAQPYHTSLKRGAIAGPAVDSHSSAVARPISAPVARQAAAGPQRSLSQPLSLVIAGGSPRQEKQIGLRSIASLHQHSQPR